MTKRHKRIRISVGILLVLIFVYMLWSPLSLTKIGDRVETYSLDKVLKTDIKEESSGLSTDEIRSYSIKKTAKLLSFSIKNNLSKGKANCVGYA